jgi:hypothetical protein
MSAVEKSKPGDESQPPLESQIATIAAPSKRRSPTILRRFAENVQEQNWTAISI